MKPQEFSPKCHNAYTTDREEGLNVAYLPNYTHTLPKIEFCQVTTLFVPVDRSLKTLVEKSLKMSHLIKFKNI